MALSGDPASLADSLTESYRHLCPHCHGTGKAAVAYIEPRALADALGITERRLRQLVQEGVIEKLVR
jgi:hypothetical protein